MKKIKEMIIQLQNVSKSNDKKEILKNFTSDNMKKYLTYVYNEVNYVYNKTRIKKDKINYTNDKCIDLGIDEFYILLDQMNSGILRGNSADKEIDNFLINNNSYYYDILNYVLKRDIKAKIGAKIINSVIPNLIFVQPYMRCEPEKMMEKRIVYETDGVKHGAIVQTKADGLFSNISILTIDKKETTDCTTRYGRKIANNFLLESMAFSSYWSDYTFHGEMLVVDENGNIMAREIGNGRLNSYFKREETRKKSKEDILASKTLKKRTSLENAIEQDEIDWVYTEKNMFVKLWDVVLTSEWRNLESDVEAVDRLNRVIEYVNDYNNWYKLTAKNSRVQIIDWKIVHSNDEVMEFYKEQIEKGEEGCVVKNLNSKWMDGTNRTGIIKLKEFDECDLICVGWNYGDEGGEFEKGIGSLICESSDGLIKVDVSGMKRKQRGFERVDPNDSSKGIQLIEGFDLDQHIGKIIATKFSYVIGDSLYLPSCLEIREPSDKNFPDNNEKIRKGK